jgi:hypothetical protein
MTTMQELTDFYGEPISVYTRAQAIEDGILVDVTEWASPNQMMGGFTCPVAFTKAVWAKIEKPSKSGEDLRGRAHDILWMGGLAARRHQAEMFAGEHIPYRLKLAGRFWNMHLVMDGDGILIGLADEDLS